MRYTALICYEIAITIHWLRSSPSAATSHGDSTLSIRKNEAPVTFRLRTGRKHIRPYVVTCIHAFFDELSVGPLYAKVFPHYFKFHGRPSGQKALSGEFFFFHLQWSCSFYFLSIIKCKIVHSGIALICTQNPSKYFGYTPVSTSDTLFKNIALKCSLECTRNIFRDFEYKTFGNFMYFLLPPDSCTYPPRDHTQERPPTWQCKISRSRPPYCQLSPHYFKFSGPPSAPKGWKWRG